MSKYNREAVEKEIKKSGVINRNQQVEAPLVHRLLKGHQEELAPLAKNVKGAGQINLFTWNTLYLLTACMYRGIK